MSREGEDWPPSPPQRCSSASRGCQLNDSGRQRGRRQAALRRQVRLLPHPQAGRHERRDRAEPRRGVPAARARTASARARSRASSTARSSSRTAARSRPRDGQAGAVMPAKLVTGARTPRTSRPTWPARSSKRGEDKGPLGAPSASSAQRGRQGDGRQARRSPPTRRGALAYTFEHGRGQRRPGRRSSREQVVDRPRHRGRGQRRQRERRGRQERRRLEGQRRPQARHLHVLLLGPGPPRGRHGGQAHREVAAGLAAGRSRAPRRRRHCWPARLNRNASANDHQDDVERDHHARRRAAGRPAALQPVARAGRSP